jgi:ligand-binding sensor domain-containing protein
MKRYTNVLLILIIINIISYTSAYSQEYTHKRYNTENGLPANETFHIIQDKKGFIWIAHNQGVSKYNGYSFTNFDTEDNLPENTTLEIFEDKKGRIWFISLMGKLSWFSNNKIHTYKYNEIINRYTNNSTSPVKQSFYVDNNDNVYISFYNMPIIKIDKEGKLQELKHNNKILNIKKIDSTKTLFSSHMQTLDSILIDNGRNVTALYTGHIDSNGKIKISCMPYGNGYIFSFANRSMIIKNNQIADIKITKTEQIWASADNGGNIWISNMWNGIKAYKDRLLKVPEFHILKQKTVTSVLNDSEGGYWFTTLNDGIFYYPSLLIKSITTLDRLKAKSISQIEPHNGVVYFAGNHSELYTYNDTSFTVSHYSHKHHKQYRMIKNLKNTLIISSYGNNLQTTFVKNSKILHKENTIFYDAVELRNNFLLYNQKITQFNRTNFVLNDLSKNIGKVNSVLKHSDSIYYIGTRSGLLIQNTNNNSVTTAYSSITKGKNIVTLEKDIYGNIYAGTKNSGVLIFNNDKKVILDSKSGLTNNCINSIKCINDTIWVATNYGLNRIKLNPENQSIISNGIFTKEDGLSSNQVLDIEIYKNKVYTGTGKGLSVFNTDLCVKNTTPPPVYIKGIKVMNRDTTLLKQYHFPYNKNNIEISFVGLNYKRDKALKYKYRLKGASNIWKETTNTYIQYPFLSHGDFIFQVVAINNSGVESSKAAELSITIEKPYYRTPLFFIIIALSTIVIISLIAWLIFYIRLREARKADNLEKQLNYYRQKALSAQMNPHFLYNSLNSVQNYILKNDKIKSSDYLSKFGLLMRRILTNSESPLIKLSEEVMALKLYIDMELMRFDNSFEYTIDIDNDISIDNIMVPPLIIQPYVENAIHHGLRLQEGDKQLKIRITKNDNRIHIQIIDNGIGRNMANKIKSQSPNEHVSYGTNITKKRLSLLKELHRRSVSVTTKDIVDENSNPSGTMVSIVIEIERYEL